MENIFQALPAYLYLNATWAGALLKPFLELQDSQTGQLFASQDLGDTYPIASGARSAPTQAIERQYFCLLVGWIAANLTCGPESGNMLIALRAHAKLSGDGTLLSQHVRVF